MGHKAPPCAHSPQLHYEDKLHEVNHFQKIIGFEQPHGFQNLGEAQQYDVPSQPAEGERPIRTCHAVARARTRRLSEGRRLPAPGRAWGDARCPPLEGTATGRPPASAERPLPPAAVTGRWAHPQAPARRRRPGPARRTAAPWRDGGSSCRERLRALRRSSGAARLPCAGSTASPAGSAARRERGERDGNRDGSGTGAGDGEREIREAELPPARVRGSSAQAPRGGAGAVRGAPLCPRGGARGGDRGFFFLFFNCKSVCVIMAQSSALLSSVRRQLPCQTLQMSS